NPFYVTLRCPDYVSTECTFIVLYIIFCAIDGIFAFLLARLKPVSSSLFRKKQISARQALKLFWHPSQFGEWKQHYMLIEEKHYYL
ncbi:hypothetical protein JTL54_34865, partial [Pseudomonas aeruginosa]|nr:hypothetical protein [Pseudomonas aeruginosa]